MVRVICHTIERQNRVRHILRQLKGGRVMTAGQIGKTYGIGHRAVYRDMRMLRDAGLVRGEAGVGYMITKVASDARHTVDLRRWPRDFGFTDGVLPFAELHRKDQTVEEGLEAEVPAEA